MPFRPEPCDLSVGFAPEQIAGGLCVGTLRPECGQRETSFRLPVESQIRSESKAIRKGGRCGHEEISAIKICSAPVQYLAWTPKGKLGWETGIEPATVGATVRCSAS